MADLLFCLIMKFIPHKMTNNFKLEIFILIDFLGEYETLGLILVNRNLSLRLFNKKSRIYLYRKGGNTIQRDNSHSYNYSF